MRGKSAAQEYMQEGKLENQLEVVKTAWQEGLSTSLAAKLTKLSLLKVEKLYKQFEAEAKVMSN